MVFGIDGGAARKRSPRGVCARVPDCPLSAGYRNARWRKRARDRQQVNAGARAARAGAAVGAVPPSLIYRTRRVARRASRIFSSELMDFARAARDGNWSGWSRVGGAVGVWP